MMKQSSRIDAPARFHRDHRAGRVWRLAALVVVTAGAGCGSDDDPAGDPPDAAPATPPDAAPAPPPDALPVDFAFKPCGLEERFVDGQLISYEHRGYDEQGNHVLSERDGNRDGVADDRFVWQYAPAGGLTLVEQSLSSGTMRSVAAQYAADGQLDFVTWMTSDGLEGRADYEYDGDQRILEHWDHDNDGVAEALTTYTYDAEGKLEESAFGCTGMEPGSITTMQWGVGGRIERIEVRDNGVLTSATQYVYDQEGRLGSWERSEEDRIVASESFEYDVDGNLIRTIRLSTIAFSETKTDTMYDVHGRVLSAETSIDDLITSRDIYLYECPDYEDSAGRSVGEPASPFPIAPAGPRAGLGLDAVGAYVFSGDSCL
jgi:YD repeat-containing protein